MIHFRDRTFCINPHCTCHPSIRLTPEVEAAAKAWMGPNAPIAVGDRCGAKGPEEQEEDEATK